MKNLNMSWGEIKNTPKHELIGLMQALGEYNVLHSFDGYTDKDVSDMRKNKPEIQTQYADYKRTKRKYHRQSGATSFKDLIN